MAYKNDQLTLKNYTQILQDLLLMSEPDALYLEKVLFFARDVYYNGDGEVPLSDELYDKAEKILRGINPQSVLFSEIGSQARLGKIKLPVTMGSLDQLYEGETEAWIKEHGWEDQVFVISDKEDGTSALSVYGEDGYFQKAYSRGNGLEGADISRHVTKMSGFVRKVSGPCVIRHEVIMKDCVFKEFQDLCSQSGERVYKNARNYVAGRMNAIVSPDFFYQNVEMISTSVVEPVMTKLDQIAFLKENGFQPAPYFLSKGFQLNDSFLKEKFLERKRESLTALDGLVIDLNDIFSVSDVFRNSSSLNPLYSKKFKEVDRSVNIGRVVCVHWSVSKHGYLKPRIEIEPLEIDGVTISFVTGFNAKFILDNMIGKGSELDIIRSGDVIPHIRKVLKSSFADMPDVACSWSEERVDLILDQDDHVSMIVAQMTDFFTRINVYGLRERSLERFFNHGLKTIESVVKAPVDVFISLLGDEQGPKVFAEMHEKLSHVSIAALAGASQCFGRGQGQRKMAMIALHYGWEFFYKQRVSVEELIEVDGFSHKTAQQVVDSWPKFQEFLKSLEGYYTITDKSSLESSQNCPLDGMSFVFTGLRSRDLEERLESMGGTLSGSPGQQTRFVIAKDPQSSSSKLKKARALNLEIITPAQFSEFLDKCEGH